MSKSKKEELSSTGHVFCVLSVSKPCRYFSSCSAGDSLFASAVAAVASGSDSEMDEDGAESSEGESDASSNDSSSGVASRQSTTVLRFGTPGWRCQRLTAAILDCLFKVFLHDSKQFVTKQRFDCLMQPMLDQVGCGCHLIEYGPKTFVVCQCACLCQERAFSSSSLCLLFKRKNKHRQP